MHKAMSAFGPTPVVTHAAGLAAAAMAGTSLAERVAQADKAKKISTTSETAPGKQRDVDSVEVINVPDDAVDTNHSRDHESGEQRKRKSRKGAGPGLDGDPDARGKLDEHHIDISG